MRQINQAPEVISGFLRIYNTVNPFMVRVNSFAIVNEIHRRLCLSSLQTFKDSDWSLKTYLSICLKLVISQSIASGPIAGPQAHLSDVSDRAQGKCNLEVLEP